MDDQGLGDDVFDAKAGVERGEGILEYDLQVAAQVPHFGMSSREQIFAFEADAAGGGLDEAENQASQSAFAGAGFSDESKGFAGVDVKGNIIDGADVSTRLAAEWRLSARKDLGQIPNFDQSHGGMLTAITGRLE